MVTSRAVAVEFRLLGPLEVRAAGGPLRLGRGKHRALLADLLVHLGRVLAVDRLVDDLWGAEAPAGARHAVEVHVSRLRKELGLDGAIVTRPPGYALEVAGECVDAFVFERLAREGHAALASGDAAWAATALREALSLWRGPPLADFTYEPFAQAEIARLEELRDEALEERVEADLALGLSGELVGELEALVAEAPLRERRRGHLMLALYRSGRQADALAAYRAARETLVEELGVDPGPQLRALEAAILRQDEALDIAAPVAEPPRARRTRRLVTVLAAEVIVPDDAAAEPEALDRVLERAVEAAAAVVKHHGGALESAVGDSLLAVFGAPVAHEDDALRAARAAVELRDALASDGGVRAAIRAGIESGEAVTGGAGRVAGDVVRVSRELRRTAADGEILIGEAAARLVRDAADLASADGVHRLVAVSLERPRAAAGFEAPLAGRAQELAALEDAVARAVSKRELQAVTIVGPAGIGKSRLARELAAVARDQASILVGRCLSYGEGITFWPLRAVVATAAGGVDAAAIAAALGDEPDAESVAERLAGALGADGASAPTQEAPFAFRRFCEALASRRPLVLVLDDLHWAEPPLLDLVEYIVDHVRAVPMLVLCLARDELLEERPRFLAGRGNAKTLPLEPLAREDAEILLERFAPSSALTPEARRNVLGAAEGNPLFLEQLLAYAAEEGAAALESGVPPTVRALLAARLDRLGPGERAVLERAAVVGREFAPAAVARLLDPAATPTVDRHLDGLVRKSFLREARAGAAFGGGFRFRHALIEDAVARATPKLERAELHERYADVISGRAGDELQEVDELVGYHLERAYRLRDELGLVDRRSRRLAEDAGTLLGAAGLRAWKRGDVTATVNLLGRATELLPREAELRRELLCELGCALAASGNLAAADDALADALGESATARDRRLELRASVELSYLRVIKSAGPSADDLLALARAAVAPLEATRDDRSLGRIWLHIAFVEGAIRCHNAEALAAAGRAYDHYRRSGWPVSTCLTLISASLYYGPAPADDAAAQCQTLLRDARDDRLGTANVLTFLAGIEAMRGRIGEACDLLARARGAYEELGKTRAISRDCEPVAAAIASLASDFATAEHALRTACEATARVGDMPRLATCAAELAEVLALRGRDSDAEHWMRVAERHAPADDLPSQYLWRAVEARLLARAGEIAAAEERALEAVALAAETDALNQHASVLLALVEVLERAARFAEAQERREEAIDLYERKGNVVAAASARSVRVSS